MMEVLAAAVGLLLFAVVLIDAFETVILPRRVSGRFRLTRLFYLLTWTPWRALARRVRDKKRREAFLSIFGPLSLLGLIGVWALGLILSFALLRWASFADASNARRPSFVSELYISGITFPGIEEAPPSTHLARTLTFVEAITGFGFLALVISYLPVMYTSFSRREANITLLDARAGSPPSAAELLSRYGKDGNMEALPALLQDWERWAAEVLESHISYPMLGFFRSQHDNQSWLGALTSILDATALTVAAVDGVSKFQAQMTFAMARHAVVDLAKVYNAAPCFPCADRLSPEEDEHLRQSLAEAGVRLRDDEPSRRKLAEMRRFYEPYVDGLSRRLLMDLPPWIQRDKTSHNWRTSKWERNVGTTADLH
jgi:hypothetical protein